MELVSQVMAVIGLVFITGLLHIVPMGLYTVAVWSIVDGKSYEAPVVILTFLCYITAATIGAFNDTWVFQGKHWILTSVAHGATIGPVILLLSLILWWALSKTVAPLFTSGFTFDKLVEYIHRSIRR